MNCTTREREEATSRKVGDKVTGFGGEMDGGCCGRQVALVRGGGRERRRERNTQAMAQGKRFPKATDWESERG